MGGGSGTFGAEHSVEDHYLHKNWIILGGGQFFFWGGGGDAPKTGLQEALCEAYLNYFERSFGAKVCHTIYRVHVYRPVTLFQILSRAIFAFLLYTHGATVVRLAFVHPSVTLPIQAGPLVHFHRDVALTFVLRSPTIGGHVPHPRVANHLSRAVGVAVPLAGTTVGHAIGVGLAGLTLNRLRGAAVVTDVSLRAEGGPGNAVLVCSSGSGAVTFSNHVDRYLASCVHFVNILFIKAKTRCEH